MEGLRGCCEARAVRGCRGGMGGSLPKECSDDVHDLCCSQNVTDVATRGQGEVVPLHILIFCA